MRIIEWNCQGAFRLKYKEIYDLQPDILIVLECEEELKLRFGKLVPSPKDFLWIGEMGKKGVGIFSYSNFKIKLLKEYNPKFKYVVPVEVSDDVNSFILFAIWAKDNNENPLSRYIGLLLADNPALQRELSLDHRAWLPNEAGERAADP